MPRLTSILSLFLLLFAAPAFAVNSVTIMADASLGVPIVRLARHYSRDHHVVVNTSFATQGAHETQITEGSAADILITPKQKWIEQLKTRGLVDIYSETAVARDRLALVGPAGSGLTVKAHGIFPTAALINQMGGEPNFVLGHPQTLTEGVVGKEALRNLGAAADMEAYTIYIKQQDEMFSMVAKEQAYGLFLYSSVLGKDGVRVIDILPEKAYRPIRYFAVVIAGDNMDEARKFMEYIKSPEAKQLLKRDGLLVD